MEINEILALYDEQERRLSRHPSYQRQETAELVRHVHADKTRRSFVIYSDLTAVNANTIIAREVANYKTIGGNGLEWKTYAHDKPPDLGERLMAHGFVDEGLETLLVLELEDAPAVLKQPITADIRRLTAVEQLADVIQIHNQVWGNSLAWLHDYLAYALENEGAYWSIYVAYVDDEPACAAWVYFPKSSPFASLWGGATVEKYRKRGVYTAVIATRLQEAIARGYRFLTVDASDMSRPILQKRGFRVLGHTRPYFWSGKQGVASGA